jgi:hypothetical protein
MYVDEAIVLGEATEQGEATLGASRGGKVPQPRGTAVRRPRFGH